MHTLSQKVETYDVRFTDHLRSGMVGAHIILVVCRVCPSVCQCMYACMYLYLSDDNFRRPWRSSFILAQPVYLQEIRVKFVSEDYRVKVKVTEAKVENPYSRNVKLRLPKWLLLKIEPRGLRTSWVLWLWWIKWC